MRVALPLAMLIPLLGALDRAVMIDDTLFLKAATQILRDPLRPFAFTVNWYGWEEPFWDVFKNPPGVAYWLAAAQTLGGTSEVALHVAMLPFAIAAVLAGIGLARRFAGDSPFITAMWAASPAFLISASTLMADVPSLAFSLWGLHLWIRGVDRDAPRLRWLGALLAGAAIAVKYTAGVSFLTLPLYAVVIGGRRGLARKVVDLAPAAIVPFAWVALTAATRGRVHVFDALLVVGGGVEPEAGWFAHRGIALLTFLAATGVFPLALVIAGLRTRLFVIGAVGAGLVAMLATPGLWPSEGLRAGVVPLVGVLAAAGAAALLIVAREAARGGPGAHDAIFLAAWVTIHLVYLWLWSWTVAGRFVLPMLVPVAFALARALGARPGQPIPRHVERWLLATAAVTLAFGALLLRADGYAGDFHRRAASAIVEQSSGRRVFFLGGWGFQHYAERAGMRRLDSREPHVSPGDLIVQPYYTTNNHVPAMIAPRLARVGNLAAAMPTLGLQTMNPQAGAGFYSSLYGPLPFFAARLPADGAVIFVVKER